MRIGLVAGAVLLLLTGCTGGPPSDPPAVAVREAHSSVASVTLAVRLRLNDSSTVAYTQVMLQTTRDAIADAQRELAVSGDADEDRLAVATPVVARATTEVSGLARAGASALTQVDLDRLVLLEDQLARVSEELGG